MGSWTPNQAHHFNVNEYHKGIRHAEEYISGTRLCPAKSTYSYMQGWNLKLAGLSGDLPVEKRRSVTMLKNATKGKFNPNKMKKKKKKKR